MNSKGYHCNNAYKNMKRELKNIQDGKTEMIKVLKFYGDEGNYKFSLFQTNSIENDKGKLAREVLGK